ATNPVARMRYWDFPQFQPSNPLENPRDHFGRYVICWPAREASAIAPPLGLTNTTTPPTNTAPAAAPSSASTADALTLKSISFRLNFSIAGWFSKTISWL